MGQAWCKEKSCKAQDSKSPLDRVFVRCAHRIYPGLKEEGSVLGGAGATQRVTSSEIGYAGSPPALLRGTSIDSVDRPFHPSDWVDVNLEVPCEPRASVTRYNSYTAYNAYQQRDSGWPLANGGKSPKSDASSLSPMSSGAPVPPPRRRRGRRGNRSSAAAAAAAASGAAATGPGDRTEDDEDDEVDPHYAKLLFGSSSGKRASAGETVDKDDAGRTSKQEVDARADSDEEFVKIEQSLKKDSAEDETKHPARSSDQQQRARPKNHSTTSLPNVAELLVEGREVESGATTSLRDEEAVRPPRHVKASSLPRDALLCAPQTPERLFFPTKKIEEDRSTEEDDNGADSKKDADNSIFKIDDDDAGEAAAAVATAAEVSADSSLRFEADVKTSTPVKDSGETAAAEVSTSSRNLEDVFLSFKDESTSSSSSSSSGGGLNSGNSSSQQHPHDEAAAAAGEEEEGERSSLFVAPHEVDGAPGGGSDDAGYESRSGSHLFSDGSNAIADECQELSSGILRDAIIDSSAEPPQQENPMLLQRTLSEESLPREMLIEEMNDTEDDESAKDASNRLAREEESFRTPPPSPAEGSRRRAAADVSPSSSTVEIVDVTEEEEEERQNAGSSQRKNSSATASSLMELEVALTDMLERKDEEERERANRSAEPEIVPTKRAVGEEKSEVVKSGENVSKSRKIEFNRAVRINPFDDYKLEEIVFNSSLDEPPEKPNRLHRISLLDEPLIVPTPPRRKHRSKSNLSGSSAGEPVVHTHALNDRLI